MKEVRDVIDVRPRVNQDVQLGHVLPFCFYFVIFTLN